MFLRKYWLPMTVFIVALVGVSLYYLQTRPPKEPIVIYKPVEPLPKSEVKAPVEDTSQGGHWHGDEWHADPHETPSQSTTVQFSEPVEQVSLASKGADLPPSIGEQVEASDDVPKYAELKAMSDEELIAMRDESREKWEMLWPEVEKRMRELAAAEPESAEAKSRLDALHAVAWKYNVYQITASRAADVFRRRLIRRNFNRPHGPGEMIIYPLPELTD